MKNLFLVKWMLIAIATLFVSEMLTAQPGSGQGRRGGGDGTPPLIGTLSGELQDKLSGDPLMFASVVLMRERDSVMVSGSITDEMGAFKMEQLPPGMYFVKINYVGYPEKMVNSIRITFREPEYDMGIIKIEPDATLLGEVTVEAARQLMETGLDRRVINVAQELTAIGGTGLDIMQNIPSVAVDFDGNVSLRGSSNVTILIDGRPSTLTGLSGSEALEQIPSEMIERVEVITNPSARYNPEGTSGIINVVLKEQRKPGYNGMVSLNAGSAMNSFSSGRYNASVNLNYKYQNWNFFTNYSTRFTDMESFGNGMRETIQPAGDASISNFMFQDINGDFGMNSHNIQLGTDYQFNRYNTLTWSSRYSNWEREHDHITSYELSRLDSSLDFENALRTGAFDMDNATNMAHNSFSHQLNFRRTFEERHRELTADAAFSTRSMDRNEQFQQLFDIDFYQDVAGEVPQNVFERGRMLGDNWSISSQLDYVHPLGEDSKLETGYRVQLREMDSDFTFERLEDQGIWDEVLTRSNHFVYNEQIYAAYLMYAGVFGNYSLQAGLRAEQTLIDGNLVNEQLPIDNDYLNLFPTLHIRRTLENNQALQLSYSRRINRPHNRNINPFMRYNSEYDVSMGNPELDPELINSFELGYNRFWNSTTINPSLFYRYTDNMITRFREVREVDGKDVTFTTFENLNRSTSYGAELIVSQRITDWWNMNATLSYFRSIIEGREAQMQEENDTYSYSGRFVSNMNLGDGWNLQLNGFYRSPIIMLQGEMDAMYSASAGVRKNVWGNSGTISLNVSDIFNTMKFSMHNYGDNFSMDMERWRNSRMITLGFTYRINEYDRRRDRRSRDGGDGGMMDFDDFD